MQILSDYDCMLIESEKHTWIGERLVRRAVFSLHILHPADP